MPKKNKSEETIKKGEKKNSNLTEKKDKAAKNNSSKTKAVENTKNQKKKGNSGQQKGKGNADSSRQKNDKKKKNTTEIIAPVVVKPAEKLNIAFLGGMNEIGKNLTMIKYGNDCILIDCGISFPDAEMFGVDLVIPDFSYIERNKENILGIFITHGHEDHIGGLPYLLRNVNIPIYATCLTCGLIEGKLSEHHLLNAVSMHVISPGDVIALGDFTVEAIHVNHSIPDALGSP